MTKILLDSDEFGVIKDAQGLNLGPWTTAVGFPYEEPSATIPVTDMVTLKEAGYTSEEIIELHKKGIL